MSTNNNKTQKTLIEAIRQFSDLDYATMFFAAIRWPSGVCCPHCGSMKVDYLPHRRLWQCRENHSRNQFSVKIGTIFEECRLSIDKCLIAIWLEVNAKNSISSCEIARALGVTQKTGWFLLHRIRHALHVGSFDTKLQGVVEVDETYVGGLSQNMHKAQRAKRITSNGVAGKTAVMGLLERHDGKKHSIVRAEVVPNRKSESLHPIIHRNVEPGTQLYTDSLAGYRGLTPTFMHDFVDHANAYVKDKVVHTNGLENFWALFKRCIKGTHISIEPFHLFRYVDSEAFRFNNREVKDADRFMLAMQGVSGKRLTYKALIGASELSPGSDKGAGNAELPN
ncbi:MAG: IS1595 family transposase [Tepidisphaeraceae bacterium]